MILYLYPKSHTLLQWMKNYQWVKDKIEKLLMAKVICSSRLSWSAPIIVVLKGDSGKQFVIDYRALNKVTREIHLAHAKVEDIFSKLKQSEVFLNSWLKSRLSSYSFG